MLRNAAERVARSYGLEIFDVQLRRESIGTVLRVVIDRPDRGVVETPEEAVGIAECQRISQDLSAVLDVEEDELGEAALNQHYTLEVSSPGLDRPLRHEADYRRFAGRLAKIVTGSRSTASRRSPAGSSASKTASWCSRKGARRIACPSDRSSADIWPWSFEEIK